MRVDICVPAYNEALILEKSTKQLYEFCEKNLTNIDWQVVLVINGSTDNSIAIAEELKKTYQHLSVVVFKKAGRSQALIDYWKISSANIVSYMDCDLAVDLEALPRLLNPLINNQADLTIGNRFHKNSLVQRSFLRELSSRSYNLLAKIIIGHKQKDLQCGFKAIKKEAFNKLPIKNQDDIWFFDTELILWANKLNLKVESIPVNWQEIRLGKRQSTVKIISTTINFSKNLLKLKKRLNNQ